MRLSHHHTCAKGFDEYMNVVLDEAEEVSIKTKEHKPLGRIMLKGDNITYVPHVQFTILPRF